MGRLRKKSFLVVLSTCASKSEGRDIIKILLKKRLVACGNIVSGVESKFWWKKKIEMARETLLVLKTERGKFKKLEDEISRLHSYDMPEIIALPVIKGSDKYLNWVSDSVSCKR